MIYHPTYAHICCCARPMMILTDCQTHSWLNNVQNIALLFWSRCHLRKKYHAGFPRLHNFNARIPECSGVWEPGNEATQTKVLLSGYRDNDKQPMVVKPLLTVSTIRCNNLR